MKSSKKFEPKPPVAAAAATHTSEKHNFKLEKWSISPHAILIFSDSAILTKSGRAGLNDTVAEVLKAAAVFFFKFDKKTFHMHDWLFSGIEIPIKKKKLMWWIRPLKSSHSFIVIRIQWKRRRRIKART